MEFDYTYLIRGLGSHTGHFDLEFNNTIAYAEIELATTNHGHIYPWLTKFHVDFGESEIYERQNPAR